MTFSLYFSEINLSAFIALSRETKKRYTSKEVFRKNYPCKLRTDIKKYLRRGFP